MTTKKNFLDGHKSQTWISATALLLLALVCASGAAWAQTSIAFGGLAEGPVLDSDPFLGDWEGEWISDVKIFRDNPKLVAQVIPRGKGKYQINILGGFDHRAVPYAVLDAERKGDALYFEQGDWVGTLKDGSCEGKGFLRKDAGDFALKQVTRLSPTLGAKPPKGATVLFDGSNFDAWQPAGNVKEISWKRADGAMQINTDKGAKRHDLETKQRFRDCKLHIEFRLPLEPENTGQGRGNSGVFLGEFEVQVLDSYGLPGYYNECGGLYKLAAPKVNMCAPPLQWQTYDIDFTAARFDGAGKLAANPRMTVLHNGVTIHDDQEIYHQTSNSQTGKAKPFSSEPGTIHLQHHGHPVAYRNIWVVEE